MGGFDRLPGQDVGSPIGVILCRRLMRRCASIVLLEGTTIVAASLLENCDENGNEFRMLKEIVDHRSDETAVKIDDGWIRRKENRPLERRKVK